MVTFLDVSFRGTPLTDIKSNYKNFYDNLQFLRPTVHWDNQCPTKNKKTTRPMFQKHDLVNVDTNKFLRQINTFIFIIHFALLLFYDYK